MTTFLPRDANENPIPVLRFKDGCAHTIEATDESAANETAFAAATRVISLYATVPVYVAFGGETVEAAETDHYFPANIYYDIAIGGDQTGQCTHIAVLAVDDEGFAYISEKE